MFNTAIPFDTASAEVSTNDLGAGSYDTQAIEPIAAPEPEQNTNFSNISLWVKEIVPSGAYDPNSKEAFFDVILSVSGPGCSGTLIKKIKFCKETLCKELAENGQTQATYVEQTEVKKDGKQLTETLKRIRELSGIPNNKNFV
jgi:hypothetical protein